MFSVIPTALIWKPNPDHSNASVEAKSRTTFQVVCVSPWASAWNCRTDSSRVPQRFLPSSCRTEASCHRGTDASAWVWTWPDPSPETRAAVMQLTRQQQKLLERGLVSAADGTWFPGLQFTWQRPSKTLLPCCVLSCGRSRRWRSPASAASPAHPGFPETRFTNTNLINLPTFKFSRLCVCGCWKRYLTSSQSRHKHQNNSIHFVHLKHSFVVWVSDILHEATRGQWRWLHFSCYLSRNTGGVERFMEDEKCQH